MTASENFVSRWARLKRASDIEPKTAPGDVQSDSAAFAGAETPPVHHEDEVIAAPFDPASLPSIETITVDTDIRGFLESRVPAALTRAALRQAWTSDPAIRDFIEIAENQWDFNDPNAMPGFGPLSESDNATAALAQALGRHDKLPDMKLAVSEEPAVPAGIDHEAADLGQSV